MSMLVVDEVKYNLWTPTSEDAFEGLVREHTRDIFGEQSLYFAIKKKTQNKCRYWLHTRWICDYTR